MLSARKLLLMLIRGYQLAISPLLGACCRFHPSCSSYTLTAVERFGAVHGTWLGVCRICRCHPLCEGGFDPVPEEKRLRG
jgi:putative membrane protein insertion efficiency factor